MAFGTGDIMSDKFEIFVVAAEYDMVLVGWLVGRRSWRQLPMFINILSAAKMKMRGTPRRCGILSNVYRW